MKAKSMLLRPLRFLLLAACFILLTRTINAEENGTDFTDTITATASLLRGSYTLGQPVPIEIAVTNHGQKPVYTYVDESGFLELSVIVEDVNGTKIEHGPIASPPPPPPHYYIKKDGKKVLTMPVVEIKPGQTTKLTIRDALNLYHDYLQEGIYYLIPRELPVIHEVGFVITREDQVHPMWIDPYTVISRGRYKINYEINNVEITLHRGKIIYVDDDAVGANDGTSWENAYTFLQDALADAVVADKPVEIRVAQGIYAPDRNSASPDGTGRRKATFQLINNVTIIGGYAGFDEVDPNARDIEAYETILSGDLSGNDIDVNDPRNLYDLPDRYDNSEIVVTGSKTDASAVLDGLTITGGYISVIPYSLGGGPIGGAGMLISSGSPTLIDCKFADNVTSNTGAGLLIYGDSYPILNKCKFMRNYAESGGGIFIFTSSSLKLIYCTFSDNYAQHKGGGIYNVSGNPILTNCTLRRNSTYGSSNKGGGMYNRNSSPVLTNCIFSENSAATGGGMYNKDSNTVLNMCKFVRNTASRQGGAVLNNGGQLVTKGCVFDKNNPRAVEDGNSNGTTFTDCIFSGNSSPYYGGAVRVEMATFSHCIFAGNVALGYYSNDGIWHRSTGGAVYSFSTAVFNNCTFSKNWADSRRAIYCDGIANVNNCIFWGSEDQISAHNSYQFLVDYSDIQGGWIWLGDGNIDADPCFVDPGYWADTDDPNVVAETNDPNAVWVDGDYHLKSQAGRWDPASQSWVVDDVTSPCIDAGDPNSPIGNEPFPTGGIINMGAYGGTVEASKSLMTTNRRF